MNTYRKKLESNNITALETTTVRNVTKYDSTTWKSHFTMTIVHSLRVFIVARHLIHVNERSERKAGAHNRKTICKWIVWVAIIATRLPDWIGFVVAALTAIGGML